jgi:hypothetical protein
MRVVVVAALLSGACLNTTSAIRPTDGVDAGAAYLYGRFFIRSEDNQSGGSSALQSVGLRLQCDDNRDYTIWFRPTRDVQVLKIQPSRCALTAVLMTDGYGVVREQLEVADADRRVQPFSAGWAHYLGDYFARGTSEVTRYRGLRGGVHEVFWGWAMDPADDRYGGTTADMKRTFPNLARLPTVERRLIPPKPAPKRGAVVISDANEPPMSPERVAQIAPFIGRPFPSPAACEAACPTGQCLPFRGAEGPAMACVVRCNADKDCPDGLACNCPNTERPEGPACRPIVTNPADRMARLCLPGQPTAPGEPSRP